MLKVLKKEGMASIVEVIVTSVIFVVAAVGILSTVSMMKPKSAASDKRLEAAYIGKGVIDQLRAEIDAYTWTNMSGNFATGVMYTNTYIYPSANYTVNYYLANVAGYPAGAAPRQLFMNVTW